MIDTLKSIQAGVTATALFLFMLAFVGFVVFAAVPVIREAWRRCRKRGPMAVFFFLALVCAATKTHRVPNADADEGIELAEIDVGYDSTNDVTAVEVLFVGHNVTTATPVSVRNDQTENWRELEKIGATVTSDLATNVLAFAVAGNVSTNRFWWVGIDKPAVIVETIGIEIVYFEASSHSVQIRWTCDDPNATEFAVQRRKQGETEWETVGVTSDFAFVFVGFTIGETWGWRVTSTYTEGEQ